MNVDTAKFCGLSRTSDFQEWLRNISSALYDDLISHLQLGKSCGSNSRKMMEILDKLKTNKLDGSLESFLVSKHPDVLLKTAPQPSRSYSESHIVTKTSNDIVAASPDGVLMVPPEAVGITCDDANVHKVFQVYKPGILFLPQQLIFIANEYIPLMNSIVAFTRTKISTDYIILKSNKYWHGYVEYLDKRFIDEADKIPREKRPIAIYKAKYGIK